MTELEKMLEDIEKEEREKWESKTAQEKLDSYSERPIYGKYCKMTIEELEEQRRINISMIKQLSNSIFSHPCYSIRDCEYNIEVIDDILKLKKELSK